MFRVMDKDHREADEGKTEDLQYDPFGIIYLFIQYIYVYQCTQHDIYQALFLIYKTIFPLQIQYEC